MAWQFGARSTAWVTVARTANTISARDQSLMVVRMIWDDPYDAYHIGVAIKEHVTIQPSRSFGPSARVPCLSSAVPCLRSPFAISPRRRKLECVSGDCWCFTRFRYQMGMQLLHRILVLFCSLVRFTDDWLLLYDIKSTWIADTDWEYDLSRLSAFVETRGASAKLLEALLAGARRPRNRLRRFWPLDWLRIVAPPAVHFLSSPNHLATTSNSPLPPWSLMAFPWLSSVWPWARHFAVFRSLGRVRCSNCNHWTPQAHREMHPSCLFPFRRQHNAGLADRCWLPCSAVFFSYESKLFVSLLRGWSLSLLPCPSHLAMLALPLRPWASPGVSQSQPPPWLFEDATDTVAGLSFKDLSRGLRDRASTITPRSCTTA